MYEVLLTRGAAKDFERVKQSPYTKTVTTLIDLLATNPFYNPPPYETMAGDMKGVYSRRINRQHRLVYTVSKKERRVLILSMWGHYDE